MHSRFSNLNSQRPKRFEISKNKLTCEVSSKRPKLDNNGAPLDIQVLSILIVVEKKEETYFPFPTEEESEKFFSQFDTINSKIGKANRLSEKIYAETKKIIRLYFQINDLDKVVERNSKCRNLKKYNFKKDLTFMESRNVLSCILKTDIGFKESINLTTQQTNYYTKLFSNYIIDRDCFTHGELFFVYPNTKSILRVKPPAEEEHYIEIEKETFENNLFAYSNIDSLLNLLSQYLRKQLKA